MQYRLIAASLALLSATQATHAAPFPLAASATPTTPAQELVSPFTLSDGLTQKLITNRITQIGRGLPSNIAAWDMTAFDDKSQYIFVPGEDDPGGVFRLHLKSRTFKVILNSVPIARFPTPPAWGPPIDRWEGYAAQREELLAHIANEPVDNVWFVSGDFHLGLVHRVEVTGRDSRLWEIATGPGCQVPRDPLSLASPQQILHLSAENAYTTFRFDPETNTVQVRFVNELGKVLFDAPLTA